MTANLKKFAQSARRTLIKQISGKLDFADSKDRREAPQAMLKEIKKGKRIQI